MLTDIFAYRYLNVPIWSRFGGLERRLVVQSFRILSESICRYYTDGKETDHAKAFWNDIQSRLSMELGVKSLSPEAYAFQMGTPAQPRYWSGVYTPFQVCETWALQQFDNQTSADEFIKQRLSLVEIGFRKREEAVAAANGSLNKQLAEWRGRSQRKTGRALLGEDPAAWIIENNKQMNDGFRSAVEELNTRFQQAECGLHYHNGFIQRSTDMRVAHEVEAPFWDIVADPKWKNVDVDMKEAIDRRDAGGRDPAFYAARALESTIKIISGEKGWTHGGERGASNYIDNLSSKKASFIEQWEAEALKLFFSKVRNPMSHGSGSEEMVSLTPQQTSWAIEFAMSWIKSLVRRM